MNRRDFLRNALLLIPPAIVAPKLIFDLGANKHHYWQEWTRFDPTLVGYGPDPCVYNWSVFRAQGKMVEMRMVLQGSNPEYVEAPYEELICDSKGFGRITESDFVLKYPVVIDDDYSGIA